MNDVNSFMRIGESPVSEQGEDKGPLSVKEGHTKAVWFLEAASADFGHGRTLYVMARGQIVSGVIATVNTGWVHKAQRDEQEANAAFIVECVNSHDSLLSRLATVEMERDELKAERADFIEARAARPRHNAEQGWDIDELKKKNAALERERDAMREALKHFAGLPLEDFGWDDKRDEHPITGFNSWKLNVGHIRKARALLSPSSEAGKGE